MKNASPFLPRFGAGRGRGGFKSFLAVDVGNTNVTVGVFRGESLLRVSRLDSSPLPSLRAVTVFLKQAAKGLSLERAAFASVVPALDRSMRRAIASAFGLRPFELTPNSSHGISLCVSEPSEVGADRLANVLGARLLGKGSAIVVDFGTATTFDCISGKGEYLGGAIVPGPRLAARALSMETAKLPEVPIEPTRRVIGKTTVECLQGGLFFGYAGMIDRILEESIREMKGAPPRILLTGGLGRLFLGKLKRRASYHEDLTLRGLRAFAAGM